MILSLEQAGPAELVDAWNRFLPVRYRIDEELVRINVLDSTLSMTEASGAWLEGGSVWAWIAVKRPAADLYPGPDPRTAHVCALVFDDESAAAALLDRASAALRTQGFEKLAFGADLRHVWPGCPTDVPMLHDLLRSYGFEEGPEVFDLERDLAAYEFGKYMYGASPEPVAVHAISRAELPLLEEFLHREFPGRWTYDTLAKIDAEGRCEFVHGLFVEGKCEGFALTQDASHRLPIGGAVWRADLGENWGSLGPIGVSTSVRGRGMGDVLLGSALLDLRARGVRRCIVDWTTLGEFYGRHGFVPTRRYRAMSMNLRTPG